MTKLWTCHKCNRVFSKRNQAHQCIKKDPGELFVGYPDELVLAFDRLLTITESWEPNHYSATKNAIVFTSHKVWLVVKLLKTKLDLKLYLPHVADSEKIHKVNSYGNHHAHHIRISSEDEIDRETVMLLKNAYHSSLNITDESDI